MVGMFTYEASDTGCSTRAGSRGEKGLSGVSAPKMLAGHAHQRVRYLVVQQRVSHDQETRLAVLASDLVGEGAWGEAAGNGLSASVLRKLEHSALRVRASTDGNHVLLARGRSEG